MTRRAGWLAVLLLGGVLTAHAQTTAVPPAGSTAAVATVEKLHATLLETMRGGKTLGCRGRIGKLTPVVQSSFDIPFIGEHILHRHWNDLSTDQRDLFITTLNELTITTYASEFSDYDGERFSTLGTRPLGATMQVVRTKMHRRNDQPIEFDYVLHKSGKSWRIVNVLADGVSDLAIRTAQYNQMLKSLGFKGLIDHLKSQIAKNRNGC